MLRGWTGWVRMRPAPQLRVLCCRHRGAVPATATARALRSAALAAALAPAGTPRARPAPAPGSCILDAWSARAHAASPAELTATLVAISRTPAEQLAPFASDRAFAAFADEMAARVRAAARAERHGLDDECFSPRQLENGARALARLGLEVHVDWQRAAAVHAEPGSAAGARRGAANGDAAQQPTWSAAGAASSPVGARAAAALLDSIADEAARLLNAARAPAPSPAAPSAATPPPPAEARARSRWEARDVAGLAYAVVKASLPRARGAHAARDALLASISDVSDSVLPLCGCEDVANLAWAYGLGAPGATPLWRALGARLPAIAAQLQPCELAAVSSALARAQRAAAGAPPVGADALGALSIRAAKLAERMPLQELCLVTSAFAALEQSPGHAGRGARAGGGGGAFGGGGDLGGAAGGGAAAPCNGDAIEGTPNESALILALGRSACAHPPAELRRLPRAHLLAIVPALALRAPQLLGVLLGAIGARVLAQTVVELSAHDAAKLACACARARCAQPALFAELGDVLLPRLHELDGRDLSLVAWAWARHGEAAAGGSGGGGGGGGDGGGESKVLEGALAEALERRAPELSEHDAATAAWAFAQHLAAARRARDGAMAAAAAGGATHGRGGEAHGEEEEGVGTRAARASSAQPAAAHAATVDVRLDSAVDGGASDDTSDRTRDAAEARLQRAERTLLALARSIAEAAARDELSARSFKMVTDAFTTARMLAPGTELARALERAAGARARSLHPAADERVALAHAVSGPDSPDAPRPRYAPSDPVAAAAPRDCSVGELSMLSWSLARAGGRSPRAFAEVAAALRARLGGAGGGAASGGALAEPACLALVAWSFATARVRSGVLSGALARTAAQCARDGELGPRSLVALAWAFARLGPGNGGGSGGGGGSGAGGEQVAVRALFDAIAATALPRVSLLSCGEASTLLWAFAVRGHRREHDDFARALWARAAAEGADGWRAAERAVATQLAQAALSARLHSAHLPAGVAPLPQPPAGVARALRDAARAPAPPSPPAQPPSPSPTLPKRGARAHGSAWAPQRELSAALRAAGWAHDEELVVDGGDGLLVVDMGCAASRVALEFDGPTHWVIDEQSRTSHLDGPTRWKSTALRALGWRVLRLGHATWERSRSSERARAELVSALLASLRQAARHAAQRTRSAAAVRGNARARDAPAPRSRPFPS
ncbi:hypothetical protein KFE25_011143 [Diacronema lutheri]|uniref:RAP domain-containing protein n=1 Tax=Diacronema lutheri TaxID=2081491 RepID=A0A8J6C9M4_DIALT|nr:hypothetical protein KFE25_011143 [Diacronema lutheri]